MRRALAPLLLILITSVPARAVPITGHAMGRVTENLSVARPGGGGPYQFTVDEPVYVTFLYDFDPSPLALVRPKIEFDLSTGGGFAFLSSPPISTLGREAGDLLSLSATGVPWSFGLRFTGDVGWMEFYRDNGGRGDVGFQASLTRTDERQPNPNPEPSTLALALIGGSLAGLGWMRRRAAA